MKPLRALLLVALLFCLSGSPAAAAELPGDRELKLAMIDQLAASPQVVLLGSSRVLKYDPRDVTRRTGRSAFNAGVSAGRPDDAWRYVTHVRSRFPEAAFPHLVWAVDVEQFRPVPGDPAPPAVGPEPSLSAGAPATPRSEWKAKGGSTFTALGYRSYDFHDRAFTRGFTLPQRIAEQIADYRKRVYSGSNFTTLSGAQQAYFVHTVRLANEWGDRPVIFLTPMHDRARRALGARGFSARRSELLGWFADQQRDGLAFDVVDLTARASFAGTAADFYDGVHLRVANTRRVIRELHRRALI